LTDVVNYVVVTDSGPPAEVAALQQPGHKGEWPVNTFTCFSQQAYLCTYLSVFPDIVPYFS